MKCTPVAIALLLVGQAVHGLAYAAPAPGFKVAHVITLGGEGGWDYVSLDAASHHLFVPRSRHVMVVDVTTDSIVGDIPNTPGVHGVAVAPEANHGFTSNGRDSSVSVFNLKTFEVIGRVKLDARGPDDVQYDAVSQRVFSFNAGSNNATAIDAATDSIAGLVALGGRPESASADGKGRMYVNLEDSSAVVAFDTRTLKVVSRWPLAPGEGPTGFAIDRVHRRTFSGCANQKLIVLDADNGHVVADLPIGKNVDGVAFDATRQLVLCSNGEGTLTVIHEDAPDHYTVVETAATQAGGRTLALDETTGTVYIPTSEFGPPPAPTDQRPHPRPSLVPGSFKVLVVKR